MYKGIVIIILISLSGCTRPLYTDKKFFNCNQKNAYFKDSDKKYLIYETLKLVTGGGNDSLNLTLIKNNKRIFVNNIYSESRNGKRRTLDQNEIPNHIGEIHFCLKSKEELQNIANKTTDFKYLGFGQITIEEKIATIYIFNVWQGRSKPKLGGRGYFFRFEKRNGEWIFKGITCGISG